MTRRKLSPFGNGPLAVGFWWLFNLAWFGGCIVTAVLLMRILIGMLYVALVLGVGAP